MGSQVLVVGWLVAVVVIVMASSRAPGMVAGFLPFT
jgi:hypothetical protein